MKKLMSYLLVAVMMLCLAGCNNEKKAENKEEKLDAKTVLTEAWNNMEALDSMDMTMDMDMNMAMGEETVAYKMNIGIQVQDNNKETMKLKMPMSINMTMDGEEETLDTTTYYADGYYYMDMMGQKVKQAMDLAEIQSTINSSIGVADIDVAGLTNLELVEKDDLYEISFVGDAESLSEYAKNVMSSLLGEDVSKSEGVSLTLDNMEGTYRVTKDKMISGMSIVMKMSITQDGETITTDYVIDITYNNPGEAVTVELPDFSEYVEN